MLRHVSADVQPNTCLWRRRNGTAQAPEVGVRPRLASTKPQLTTSPFPGGRSSCDSRWILRQSSISLNASPTEPAQPNAEISR